MNRMCFCVLVLLCAILVVSGSPVSALTQKDAFDEHCQKIYRDTGVCPEKVCRPELPGAEEKGEDEKICVARKCTEILLDDCPEQYCAVMTDCSNQKICHFQMEGEKALCGDLAYAGQDVDCCEGLVRRCGIEFIDATCDMEGRNSVYNLPICIPCGDGICGNFENRCNCPEDCGTAPQHGGSMLDLPFGYVKPMQPKK